MTVLFSTTLWTLLYSLICPSYAVFSSPFKDFLIKTYGKEFADRMTRNDLGPHASFGGGDARPVGKNRKPSVVLVHGLASTAFTLEPQRQYLLKAGWNKSDIYGTTYGKGDIIKYFGYADSLKCEYVKQVRSFIQAVAAYTKGNVDVLGYSMGSPISRKAILGGKCVDTGEDLGPPLTSLVDTFVSVAGANHGSFLCTLPVGELCNATNGFICSSEFLKDINAKRRYEGHRIFTIYSMQDEIIGYHNTCGSTPPSITGADKEFETIGNHNQAMVNSAPLQANLIVTLRADCR